MSDHSHNHGSPGAPDPHEIEHIKKHVKVYIAIFVALLVGTVLTVGMYYVHIPSVAWTIAIALFIASIKASLVALYFMHLLSERQTIYLVLGTTALFFAGLMGITLWSMQDFPGNSLWPTVFTR
jgi:cytochrome c oxidase subunit 4